MPDSADSGDGAAKGAKKGKKKGKPKKAAGKKAAAKKKAKQEESACCSCAPLGGGISEWLARRKRGGEPGDTGEAPKVTAKGSMGHMVKGMSSMKLGGLDGRELLGGAEHVLQFTGSAMQRGLREAQKGVQAGLEVVHQDSEDLEEHELAVEERSRTWELNLCCKSFEYCGNGKDEMIDAFFAVTICPDGPSMLRGRVRLLPEYTPAFILEKGKNREECTLFLDQPLWLYERKRFRMSYQNLSKHIFKVDMWKVSQWTFNKYVGVGIKNLRDVATSEPNMHIKLKQKVTQKEIEEKKKKKVGIPDVAVFECIASLEEMFNFKLYCENWTLELSRLHPQYKVCMQQRKCLTFVIPRDGLGSAVTRRRCHVATSQWVMPPRFFVQNLDRKSCVFRGTKTSLQNSFFIVIVHSGNPLFESLRPMYMSIGTALFGLTSVLNLSVFKGKVKALCDNEESFNVGVLTGSVRCIERSLGHKEQEEIPGGRPRQPKSEKTVSHLNSKEMHLVVRVFKCEGLAVGDVETGTSDPYLRVMWDNMVQLSDVKKQNLNPLFNHACYFPVRFFDRRIMNPSHEKSALVFELASKGDIKIQVWDDDNTSADFLGAVEVTMGQILQSKTWQRRNLFTSVSKSQQAPDAEFELSKAKPKQWYEKEQDVRIFGGDHTEIIGCALPKTQNSFMSFETYFFPHNFPDDIEVRKQDKHDDEVEHWGEKAQQFKEINRTFTAKYAAAFPLSIGGYKEEAGGRNRCRRFPCVSLHPHTPVPTPTLLPAFLAKIITPEEYSRPAMLLHWMNCITFRKSAAQESSGLIPPGGWKDPQTLLSARKGTVQDHAILLCSVLLGSGKDAYVCKGTIMQAPSVDEKGQKGHKNAFDAGEAGTLGVHKEPRLVEHCWVMTRNDETGYVTFWEPCSRDMYHLPSRCKASRPSLLKPRLRQAAESFAPKFSKDRRGSHPLLNIADLIHAAKGAGGGGSASNVGKTASMGSAGSDESDGMASTVRWPLGKQTAKGMGMGMGMGMRKSQKEREREEQLKERDSLPFAPNKQLLVSTDNETQNATLVDWLPYESIEVIFNRENVWANHQNHHPACIMYDLHPSREIHPPWVPLLTEKEKEIKEYNINFISPEDVILDPELKPERLNRLEEQLTIEMKENMRLFRQKRGMDTNWDRDAGDNMKHDIVKFLHILEKLRKLDYDFCPLYAKTEDEYNDAEDYLVKQLGVAKEPYNRHGSPFLDSTDSENYVQDQVQGWHDLLHDVSRFLERKKSFPVKKGKRFKGHPVHFSTADKDEIRAYLMEDKEYTAKFLDIGKDEGVVFSVHCKIFGLLGGIQSTWLYFGMQEPMADKRGNRRIDD